MNASTLLDKAAIAFVCALCLGGLQHVIFGVIKTAECDEHMSETAAWVLLSVVFPFVASFLVASHASFDRRKVFDLWPFALGPILLGCVAVYTGGFSASDPSYLRFGAIPVVLLQCAFSAFGAWLRLRPRRELPN
jgi:hypothetical protein